MYYLEPDSKVLFTPQSLSVSLMPLTQIWQDGYNSFLVVCSNLINYFIIVELQFKKRTDTQVFRVVESSGIACLPIHPTCRQQVVWYEEKQLSLLLPICNQTLLVLLLFKENRLQRWGREEVELSKTVQKGNWSSLFLPFQISVQDIAL